MTKIIINGIEYNTYATVEEADEYLNIKYGSSWSNYDADKKAKLLINATREIDKKNYAGQKVDESQPLKFPRLICVQQTNESLVKQATMELADNLSLTSSATGGTANLQAIKSMKVGDTDITFKDDAVLEDPTTVAGGVIDNLLKPYLKGNAEIWL